MVLGFVPGTGEFRPKVRLVGKDEHRVGGKEIEDGHPLDPLLGLSLGPVHGQNDRHVGDSSGSLRAQFEVPEFDNVVTEKLEPHRVRHAKRIDVENTAAYRELRHVVDHGDALEADRFEMGGEFGGAPYVTPAQFEAGGA